MDTVRLGATGLEVSRLCLGCMTFGSPDPNNAGKLLLETWVAHENGEPNGQPRAVDPRTATNTRSRTSRLVGR